MKQEQLLLLGMEMKDLFNKYNVESINGEVKLENGTIRFKNCSIRESVTVVNDFIVNEQPEVFEEARPIHENPDK